MTKEIEVRQISQITESGECQIIDVREFSEFNSERIEGAQLKPLSNFEKQVAEIDPAKPVYLMCRSGGRAKQAAEKLSHRGFSDIYVITGGMKAGPTPICRSSKANRKSGRSSVRCGLPPVRWS